MDVTALMSEVDRGNLYISKTNNTFCWEARQLENRECRTTH